MRNVSFLSVLAHVYLLHPISRSFQFINKYNKVIYSLLLAGHRFLTQVQKSWENPFTSFRLWWNFHQLKYSSQTSCYLSIIAWFCQDEVPISMTRSNDNTLSMMSSIKTLVCLKNINFLYIIITEHHISAWWNPITINNKVDTRKVISYCKQKSRNCNLE